MTPFQRQIFEAEKAREAREKQKQMDAARGGDMGGRRRNAAHPNSGATSESSETVRYVSGEENPEANVTFVD